MCGIRPPFSTPVAFESFWFRNGATAGKSKTCIGSAGDCSKYWLENFAHLSPIFTQSIKKCIIWFRNEATYRIRTSTTKLASVYGGLLTSQILCSWVHPTPRTGELEATNLHKSPIN